MKNNRFDPSKYASKAPSSTNSEPEFVFKGKRSSSDPDFDINDIKRAISNLREHYDYNVVDLSGKLREDFNMVSNFIKRLNGTPTYELIETMVDEKFNNLEHSYIGTVGQYFIGCRVNTSFSDKNPGCSPACAGAMPRGDRFWSTCANPVVVAENSHDGFKFNYLNKGDDKSHAYVFVNYENINDFPGFSKKEKKQLKKMGVNNIYLHGHLNNDYNYDPLTSSSVEVDKIKGRKTKPSAADLFGRKDHSDDDGGFLWGGIIALIIFIVLLIILFAFIFVE